MTTSIKNLISYHKLNFSVDEIAEIKVFCEKFAKITNQNTTFFNVKNNKNDSIFLNIHKKINSIIEHDLRLDKLWIQWYDDKTGFNAHRHGRTDKQCGIIYLDDIGGTHFVCDDCDGGMLHFEKSSVNKCVMFPSWLIHYVFPHQEENKIRYIIAFNL